MGRKLMNFIQRFLRNFDPRTPANQFHIIDHGDPQAAYMTPPTLLGAKVVKPPASLQRFAKTNRTWFNAGNGEVVDPERNKEIMCEIAPESFWREVERDARL